MSTKLKLMGVDVASFGNCFADDIASRSTLGSPNRPSGDAGPGGDDDAPPADAEAA